MAVIIPTSTYPTVTAEQIAGLAAIVGEKNVITETDALDPYLREWRGLFRGAASVVARPETTQETAALVRYCVAQGLPIVPQGGNTGLCGGAVSASGMVILNLGRMNKIRNVDPLTYTMTVEAGCVLQDLQAVASDHDRLFPLSLAAEGSCQIGGNLSTNAGGTAVLRYGNTRDLVLGLEVVLPDGQIWEGLRRLRKDNTGYDLKHLFLGGEGTLGIITAVVLKLFPKPRQTATALVAVRDAHAATELLSRARGETGDAVTAFELMNRTSLAMVWKHLADAVDPIGQDYQDYVLIELTSARQGNDLVEALENCLANAVEAELVIDAAIAQNDAQSKAFWRLREAVPDVQKFEGGSIKHDVSVPVSRIADFIVEATKRVESFMPGVRVVSFGHVGDGNVHFNLTQPVGMDRDAYMNKWNEFNKIVHDLAMSMEGSFSAEHGVGQLKLSDMRRFKSPTELDLMRRVKAAFDPLNLMNPGKVVPPAVGDVPEQSGQVHSS
ncbi:MAG: FAD-binding oxidoreductase [Elsteraceae bacterium]